MPWLQTVTDFLPPIIMIGAIVGVIGKYVYDFSVRYGKADDKTKVKWDWKGFWLTAIVSLVLSLLLYGVILDRVEGLEDNVLIFSIAAQNGFFWQSIVGEFAKDYGE